MQEDLSRLVTNIFSQAKAGEDSASGIRRVRAVIKKVIEDQDTVFGRFYVLLESFRDVIPDEQQRYQAAVQALSTTSKLSRQEIVAAVNNQRDKLKILEKLLLSALPSRREEFEPIDARLQKIRSELSRLREEIALLEKDEKEIAGSMAERKKETEAVEKALREVFMDFGAEISSIRQKVEELHGEQAVRQPFPNAEIKIDQPEKNEVQSINPELRESIFPEPKPSSDSRKKCMNCGGQMDYYIAEKKWVCFSCAFEEAEKHEEKIRNSELSKDSIFPEAVPGSGPDQPVQKSEPMTISGPALTADQRQKCPMCGGQMDFYAADQKWQCYSCGFEHNDEGRVAPEEKPGRSKALLAIPLTEPLFDHSSKTRSSPGYWGSKKEPPVSKKLPATRTCPACGKKMQSTGLNGWQCGHCGYERRI